MLAIALNGLIAPRAGFWPSPAEERGSIRIIGACRGAGPGSGPPGVGRGLATRKSCAGGGPAPNRRRANPSPVCWHTPSLRATLRRRSIYTVP